MKKIIIGLVALSSVTAFAAFDCQLKTPFDGTFVAKASTELEAKREAIKACEEKTGDDFWCGENKVKCTSISAKLCLLKTPFNGTFEGYGPTELEAKRAAVNACEEKTGDDFWCDQNKVKCSDL